VGVAETPAETIAGWPEQSSSNAPCTALIDDPGKSTVSIGQFGFRVGLAGVVT